MDLMTVNNVVWIASERDGLLLYHCNKRGFLARWVGRGFCAPLANITLSPCWNTLSSPFTIPHQPGLSGKQGAGVSLQGTSASLKESGVSLPLSMSWGVVDCQPENKGEVPFYPFRIVCMVTVPSLNCVLVNHTDGSVAVFGDNPLGDGTSIDHFEPIINHDPLKGHEVCCMAQVQRNDGQDEVWLGLYSGEVAIVSGEELTKPGLLRELSSRAHM